MRGDETCWFLGAADYAGTAKDNVHSWDEYERMALEDADEEYAEATRAFWNGHLPILISVESEYQFMAIDVGKDSKTFGALVEAEALAFDDASVWAASYEKFLRDIVTCVDDPAFDGIIGLHILTPEQHEERRPARDKARKGKSLLERLFKR